MKGLEVARAKWTGMPLISGSFVAIGVDPDLRGGIAAIAPRLKDSVVFSMPISLHNKLRPQQVYKVNTAKNKKGDPMYDELPEVSHLGVKVAVQGFNALAWADKRDRVQDDPTMSSATEVSIKGSLDSPKNLPVPCFIEQVRSQGGMKTSNKSVITMARNQAMAIAGLRETTSLYPLEVPVSEWESHPKINVKGTKQRIYTPEMRKEADDLASQIKALTGDKKAQKPLRRRKHEIDRKAGKLKHIQVANDYFDKVLDEDEDGLADALLIGLYGALTEGEIVIPMPASKAWALLNIPEIESLNAEIDLPVDKLKIYAISESKTDYIAYAQAIAEATNKPLLQYEKLPTNCIVGEVSVSGLVEVPRDDFLTEYLASGKEYFETPIEYEYGEACVEYGWSRYYPLNI